MDRGHNVRGASSDDRSRIGIIQGRLSPPIAGKLQAFPADTWDQEFARAAEAGLDAIEWIFDARENPLLSPSGAARVRELTDATGVRILSVCADYFMDAPLLRVDRAVLDEHVTILRALLEVSGDLGVRHIVLPFVDQAAIADGGEREQVSEVIGSVSEKALACDVELHLETSLPPDDFAALLDGLPAIVRANYDSGNSASLGYDVREEFAAYGDRVGSVHIKDRLRGSGSVPLGTGDVDFTALFDAVGQVGYAGLFTLQVARGATGDEVAWARQNREFVLRHLATAGSRR